jgi:quercetin dioxygenase-like cupin family protein
MRRLASFAILVSLLAPAANHAQVAAAPGDDAGAVRITRVGSLPSSRGPAENFIGTVRVDRLFQANAQSRASGGLITFEPGARTAWHSHPLGQVLVVTAGMGWVQREGGPVEEIRPGDVVWIAPGVKHWHGATATTGMSHIAITERLDGRVAEWMEQVSDEQYRR